MENAAQTGKLIASSSARSPFIDIASFEAEALEVQEGTSAAGARTASPFLSIYELEGHEDGEDPDAEAVAEFLAELYDLEFDEAVVDVVNEAAALVEDRFASETGDPYVRVRNIENLLQAHFAPLAMEIDAFLDSVESNTGNRNPTTMKGEELEALIDEYAPYQTLSPSFERLFGFVKKAFKKVVDVGKKVAKTAAKFGAGFIFKKLRKLVKPLLQKVLNTAINKLPAPYRPLATTVARKLGFLKELEEEFYETDQDAIQDITEIQREFNGALAQLVFADTEAEEDLAVAHYVNEMRQPPEDMLSDLDRARDRFAQAMVGLDEGEDPAPHVENFVAAILPALRLGISVIGRPKVVSFLARLVAKLIRRLVGKRNVRGLSLALVDAGLRLINLEATPEDERRAAGDAIAAVVEGTVRKIAAVPEDVLEDVELLEGFVLDAFESQTAALLPPVLSEEVYEARPDLREAEAFKSAWVRQPLHGPKRYNKCTRIFDVSVMPRVAEAITTFGGHSLAGFLRDQLGLPAGLPVRARVHLYEAIPGTLPGLICWHEKRSPDSEQRAEPHGRSFTR